MKNSYIFTLISGIIILILFYTQKISFFGLIGLLLLLVIISTIWYSIERDKERKKNKNNLNKELANIKNFNPTKKKLSDWGMIAIDAKNEKIAIKENSKSFKIYPYSAILSCEILEDNKTTYRKSNTLGRAIIGGIIAGGPGAIIGGLSGKEKQNKEIKSLDLKIVVNDIGNPSFKICFFDAWDVTNNTKSSIKISDPVYGPIFNKSLENLKNWKDNIEIIIDRKDKENNRALNHKSQSISDEINKLFSLKEKGALTAEEFEIEKNKLIKGQ